MSHIATPFFALNPLDKMDELRATIEVDITDTNARFLMISKGKLLVRSFDQTTLFTADDIGAIPHEQELSLFLGGIEETRYFALSVSIDLDEEQFELVDYRSAVFRRMLPLENLGMLAQAGGVLEWHRSHGFCSNCGHETKISHGGWRRDCPGCEKEHFPRLDPVTIMLVTHGDNCLIGASHYYPERMYSCLAGFIEPGETLENAARRELYEEANIQGGQVQYICSQPWPFPHSLMIGVHVEAETTEITMDEKELRDVRWVSKDDVRAALANPKEHEYFLPHKLAIARTLFDYWLKS